MKWHAISFKDEGNSFLPEIHCDWHTHSPNSHHDSIRSADFKILNGGTPSKIISSNPIFHKTDILNTQHSKMLWGSSWVEDSFIFFFHPKIKSYCIVLMFVILLTFPVINTEVTKDNFDLTGQFCLGAILRMSVAPLCRCHPWGLVQNHHLSAHNLFAEMCLYATEALCINWQSIHCLANWQPETTLCR